MKADTPDLMKFKKLQRRLKVSVPELVGMLELLWRATAKNAMEGDIGRFSNEDIAIACHWEGDADLFVLGLVECGWLDESDEWRLVVHDWPEHAPRYVHGNMKRYSRSFRTTSKEARKEPESDGNEVPNYHSNPPIGGPTESPTEPPCDGATKCSQVKSSVVKSSQVREEQAPVEPTPSRHLASPEFVVQWDAWKNKQAVNSGLMMDAFTERAQLYELESFDTSEAIAIVRYSVSRTNCRNLITTGDHKGRSRASPKAVSAGVTHVSDLEKSCANGVM